MIVPICVVLGLLAITPIRSTAELSVPLGGNQKAIGSANSSSAKQVQEQQKASAQAAAGAGLAGKNLNFTSTNIVKGNVSAANSAKVNIGGLDLGDGSGNVGGNAKSKGDGTTGGGTQINNTMDGSGLSLPDDNQLGQGESTGDSSPTFDSENAEVSDGNGQTPTSIDTASIAPEGKIDSSILERIEKMKSYPTNGQVCDPNGWYCGECVSFVKTLVPELAGISWGNANGMYNNASDGKIEECPSCKVTKEPVIGSVFVTNEGGYGHTGIVTDITKKPDGSYSITVADQNYDETGKVHTEHTFTVDGRYRFISTDTTMSWGVNQ
ncbi:MAG: CHAP domain-containing protein [Desulfobulbaceae bacterium]|nr:CHAP domain-containing protein [Desulfobulbaceae bacterium]